jgi:Fe2+ or Zn2+ uptake regulation protein
MGNSLRKASIQLEKNWEYFDQRSAHGVSQDTCKLIIKVKTEKDVMRYDAVMERHHHLYCSESDRIEDFVDTELNDRIEKYFDKKKIKGFKIEDVKLQIIGKFLKNKK